MNWMTKQANDQYKVEMNIDENWIFSLKNASLSLLLRQRLPLNCGWKIAHHQSTPEQENDYHIQKQLLVS